MNSDEPDPLRGQVCIVTGAASGIGKALAHRFARAGMSVVLADIETDALNSTLASWPVDPARVHPVTCDVCSVDDMARLRTAALDRFGDIHVVCLNAGVAPTGPILETPAAVWDWVFDVNVRGVVNGINALAPTLVERGRGNIVCTASAAGLSDTPTVGAYSATKHAVVGIATALRYELADAGVGVSVLCPGLIDTKIFESERNRPAGMDDPSLDNHTTKLYRDLLTTDGVSPGIVADFVHRAVLDNQFFVFPTADFDPAYEVRLGEIRQGLQWRDRVAADF
ncbi:SDR family NAD(P)-dependent oxidoreductase [Mycobacteroides abscessus]|uniref:SDR family NAD(P)-dependent oxidoreductase n=1 Tax=Mycobacteroides abscessus TaxID=36809 RepID=UPI00092970C9|nr:SDR family NAD(P)-dependent oxidoreductase [Mycobacteroides abscessus]MDO3333965.1 SDR family NAD(P)-dependent oxidoreductase [Mycobacteroides abscessus subsp. bolletii]QSM91463.1 SDR family NAD(P)-dependent oxidoreductase [Mycobacteroides abscessus subsp. bolletii]SIB91680.1 short chain dehydrogenase [Mycobacteroides abscessus subsp. bolletii]SKS85995.1 short chain dehydrogenase [Mycobacteroides abscessus subsp. bolletii]SKT09936.1 short chain dehydrogenase [Mycobacteroides abscessus subsp